MRKSIKETIKSLPFLGPLLRERDLLYEQNSKLRAEQRRMRAQVQELQENLTVWKKGFVPPGHFYSPLPDMDQVRMNEHRLFSISSRPEGIAWNEEGQLALLEKLGQFLSDMPFSVSPGRGRYYLDNDFYAHSDGICLYSMMRLLQPRKFVEIGSGFSSCAALDTADMGLAEIPEFTFIDPDPSRVYERFRSGDLINPRIRIVESMVQDVPLALFESLCKNDVLLIDSSHVSKIGSDVNFIYFQILPRLQPGVYVHVHDIFYPFEYPKLWLEEGRAWNEIYLLHAFLSFNDQFQIAYFNHFMETLHRDAVQTHLPLCLEKPSSAVTVPGSIWLRRL